MTTKLALVNQRYRLGEAFAPSGEAVCHRAIDTRTGAAVVLKVAADDVRSRARLVAEAEQLSSLDHPSLPAVVELGTITSGPLRPDAVILVTELLVGTDARSAKTFEDIARVLADAALALDALHSVGLVHHDVKPEHLVSARDGRYRLIDLGLVQRIGSYDGRARGTLAYLSPDALAGSSEPAVDLFALGVTGYELLAGTLPFDARDPATLLAAHAGPLPPPPGPKALAAVVMALLAIDPSRRPTRAHFVADELERAGLVRRRPAFVRRAALDRPGFVSSKAGRGAALEALMMRATTQRAVAVAGESGSGRTRMIVELDRRRALAALREGRTPARLVGPTLVDAARELGDPTVLDAPRGTDAARARAVVAARVMDALVANDATLHLADPDARVIDAFVEAARRLPEAAGLRLIVETTSRPPDAVVLEPLDDEELRALCARVLDVDDPSIADALTDVLHGNCQPGAVIELLRLAPTASLLRSHRTSKLEARVADAVARLSSSAQRALANLAAFRRPVSPSTLGADERDLAALELAHLVVWVGESIAPASSVVVHAVDLTLVEERLLDGAPLDAAMIAHVLGRGDAAARAERALLELIEDPDGAASLLDPTRALTLARLVPGDIGGRIRGELLVLLADYEGAIRELVTDDPATQLVRARALRLAGHRDESEALARRLVTPDNEVGSAAEAFLARLLLDRGALREARAIADRPGDEPERIEVRGASALRLGDVETARRCFRSLAAALEDAAPSRRARAFGLDGMAAQADALLDEATTSYTRALELAEQGRDLHGAAVYAQNLGGTLRELGEHARALPVLERAVEALDRIGRADERAYAIFNLGNLQLSLGDLDAARDAAARSLRLAESPHARLYARLLEADVHRRDGSLDAALAIYESLSPAGDDERLLVEAALAEAHAERGGAAHSIESLGQLRAASCGTPAMTTHAALAEAHARLATDDAPLPAALVDALREDGAHARRANRRDRSMRVEVTLARDAVRRGALGRAREHLSFARHVFEEIRMRTPELRRAALADDPDVRRLHALVDIAEPSSVGPSKRLLEINKQLNSELDLDRLLSLIMDTVIELSRAERGFLLMRTPTGELEVRVERNVEEAARAGVAAFSRSIAERAASLGEAVVTVDAADDQRFEAALSVTDLRLRSVLAVPLSVKGRVVGCVYVDHRARVGLFRPADVALVSALAEQAAIAVENARLIAENVRREAEVRALNRELEARLASQSVELEGMHREVREARRKLGVRYDYGGLIGQTPRMLELFRLLDRVTDTALPVVIYGESGTGKELVARAIHHNGPRRKAAFVSESCGAIPETLLEAALFGHVRGAFTGAQGERRGLFEIADGGTLFLDEVGEMSPAMQVRLLRVLQEGEFRRVGGEKVLKVDVRVLVASNRDLGRMVEEGRFREDLFYRLNVVRVGLPPLRERAADIPLLVEHFLAARPKSHGITRRALERLGHYRWPGNIRQLENEIARASSLAEGPIDLPDLSPQIITGSDEAEVAEEPLDLHGRVERLERGLLEEALTRTAGNQSEAARLLGLSRFGLQKKLQRYEMKARR